MSDTPQHIIIKTGTDPRNRPEFNAIREEINKINHPARPEVNWGLIESLALTLFRTHGVDLQTAVYYTLARTQKNGLAGFTEGCELLAGMVVGQWDHLWPEQPQARSEILEWFNTRVSNQLRQHDFTRDDLRLVYRAERALQLLYDKLQQVELKRVPRIENLLYLMQNTAKKLESASDAAKAQQTAAPLKMPPMVYLSVPEAEPVRTAAAAPEPAANIEVRSPPPETKRGAVLWGFGAGVLCSLLVATAVYVTQFKPLQQQMTVLATQPESAALLWLNRPDVATYGEQLSTLENLSPLFVLNTADQSVAMARQRWPSDPSQVAESQRWARLVEARIGLAGTDSSYFQLQQRLHALSEKLLEQERSRGSLTISYLKTAVYQMQTELNREIPLEELLRQLAVSADEHQPASPVLIKQID
ncbi:VasL domain-containing protein, partial [Yersinia pseudotuberculosis]